MAKIKKLRLNDSDYNVVASEVSSEDEDEGAILVSDGMVVQNGEQKELVYKGLVKQAWRRMQYLELSKPGSE